ncbi:uncharacterized protein LOC134530435 [Bacillus rossius redtenbacheri]|uniref:uncharacterized protein LOC134530435 n=1 Tax=Bacillus rossius redtenbacheri TaxID=93214 RepID=UPI002FDD0EC4
MGRTATTTAAVLLLALAAVGGNNDPSCRRDVWARLKARMIADLDRCVAGDGCRLARDLVLSRVGNHSAPPLPRELDVALKGIPSKGLLDLVLLKKSLDVFRSHALTWRAGDRVNVTVFRHDEGRGRMDLAVSMLVDGRSADGRTFGARKRIAMVLLPIVFKLGVMSTLLVGLTVLVLKGLAIGVILLVLAFGNLFGKAAHHQPHGWAPPPPRDVHVHVHVDGPQLQPAYHGWHEPHSHVEYPPHAGYDRAGRGDDDPRSASF